MANIRIYEIARKVGLSNKEILEISERLGIIAKSHSSSISDVEANRIHEYLEERRSEPSKKKEYLGEKKGRKRVVRLRKAKKEPVEDDPGEKVEETPETSETSEMLETAEGIDVIRPDDEVVVDDSEPETEPEPESVVVEAEAIETVSTVEVAIKDETVPDKPAVKEDAEAPVSKSDEKKPDAKEKPSTEGKSEVGDEKSATDKKAKRGKSRRRKKKKGDTGKGIATGDDVKPIKIAEPKRTAKIIGQIDVDQYTKKKRPPKEDKPVRVEADKTVKPGEDKTERDPKKSKKRKSRRRVQGYDNRYSYDGRRTKRRRTSKMKKSGKPSTLPRKEKLFVPKKVTVSGKTTVGELSIASGKLLEEVENALVELGYDNPNPGTILDTDELGIVLEALQCEPVYVEPAKDMKTRPPVVAVLGHVDHGKTTLLDAIRNTNVVDSESGGITQHIGASVINHNGQDVVFLDTPGHEVFTAMRARGAQVTDILVLVVAADDGVMPQTVESINHAKAAELPIIVAITKSDLPGADPLKTKSGLANYGILTEDWGGEVQAVEIAALKGEGIDELLEAILLQAEMQELTSDYKSRPNGVVIESHLDRGRGPVVSILVKEGVVKQGDVILINDLVGKIRALSDDNGDKIKTVGPSMPAEILGCEAVPQAGDSFVVLPNQKIAKQISTEIQNRKRMATVIASAITDAEADDAVFSLDDWFKQVKEGEENELNLVLKGDVTGSVEALEASVSVLGNDEVKTKILHAAAGNVSESDVLLASTSNAIIIAFRVTAEGKAKSVARQEGIEIREYSVIYEALADIRAALEGLLEPEIIIETIGDVEVRQVFAAPGGRRIAGSYVRTGKVVRGAIVSVMRGGKEICETTVETLKRFTDDVREVENGLECGIGLAGFTDIKEGDQIIVRQEKKVARRLESKKA